MSFECFEPNKFIQPSKSASFFVPKVFFLGYVISASGLAMDQTLSQSNDGLFLKQSQKPKIFTASPSFTGYFQEF